MWDHISIRIWYNFNKIENKALIRAKTTIFVDLLSENNLIRDVSRPIQKFTNVIQSVSVAKESWHFLSILWADLPKNCHLNVKNLTFFPKKLTKIVIFSTKLPLSSFWQFFDIQMAIFRRVSYIVIVYYRSDVRITYLTRLKLLFI